MNERGKTSSGFHFQILLNRSNEERQKLVTINLCPDFFGKQLIQPFHFALLNKSELEGEKKSKRYGECHLNRMVLYPTLINDWTVSKIL